MLKFLSYLTRAVPILVTMHLRSHQTGTGRSSFRSIYMVHRNATATTLSTSRNDDDSDYTDSDDDDNEMPLPPSLAATDSEDNSDSMAFQRGASAGGNTSGAGGSSSAASPAGGKSGRPCQYNFLVNLGEFLDILLLERIFTKLRSCLGSRSRPQQRPARGYPQEEDPGAAQNVQRHQGRAGQHRPAAEEATEARARKQKAGQTGGGRSRCRRHWQQLNARLYRTKSN